MPPRPGTTSASTSARGVRCGPKITSPSRSRGTGGGGGGIAPPPACPLRVRSTSAVAFPGIPPLGVTPPPADDGLPGIVPGTDSRRKGGAPSPLPPREEGPALWEAAEAVAGGRGGGGGMLPDSVSRREDGGSGWAGCWPAIESLREEEAEGGGPASDSLLAACLPSLYRSSCSRRSSISAAAAVTWGYMRYPEQLQLLRVIGGVVTRKAILARMVPLDTG